MTKRLTILGSTGSIGTQALEVALLLGFTVAALTADTDARGLEAQIRRVRPRMAALADERAAKVLAAAVADTDTRVLSGAEGVAECARLDTDCVLNAVVGMAGLYPTLAALEAGHDVALANKEALVAGGELVLRAAERTGAKLLPVDSEHSAVFQSIQGKTERTAIKRIILTASGGPFFGMGREELRGVRAEDALKHPNWSMGAKITVDSATMMNKGLELIEAVRLFGVPPEAVDIVVHRQSIVHSAVEFEDNSCIAQLGLPDMRIPIQYALTYPERYPSPVASLRLEEIGALTFEKPDDEVFPCMNICRRAVARGGNIPAAVNSANEEANLLFRRGRIGFLDISELVSAAAEDTRYIEACSYEDICETDVAARRSVLRNID